jgi:hypothetical protein
MRNKLMPSTTMSATAHHRPLSLAITYICHRFSTRARIRRNRNHPLRTGFPKLEQPRRTVSFDTLEIYGFPKVLGDHPCADGAAIRLDSDPEYRLLVSVDDYERHRLPRREGEYLRLSSEERENYLLAAGYCYDDVAKAASRNANQRQERWESLQRQRWEPFCELLEHLRGYIRTSLRWLNEGLGVWIAALWLLVLAYILSSLVQ